MKPELSRDHIRSRPEERRSPSVATTRSHAVLVVSGLPIQLRVSYFARFRDTRHSATIDYSRSRSLGRSTTSGGVRMVKMVFLVHRKAGMDEQDFRRYWRETHGPKAARIPGLRKYVQNHSIASVEGGTPPYDGFSEMWFDSPESLETPEAQAAVADTANFTDVDRTQGFIVEEVDVL